LPREETVNGVRVFRFRSWAPGDAYYFSGFLREYLTVNSNVFDILHAHSYHAFPAFYAARAKNGNKLIFTPHYHGTGHTILRRVLHVPYKFLGKKIFAKADHIICVSSYERNLVMKHFRVSEEKISVIPNGINSVEFKSLKKRGKDHKTVLFVGRLEKYKCVDLLIRVLPKLGSNVVLDIIGKGPHKDNLVKLAAKQGVKDRIEFFEDLPRSELLQKYCDADLFVSLSKHEAYGICVAEALACGVPCIVTDTSALREWIDNESCFGISSPIDLQMLAGLIGSVIGRNIKAERLPDWDEISDSVAELYES
jgi:glycosyltransferase involved in cell wall biosynthesis